MFVLILKLTNNCIFNADDTNDSRFVFEIFTKIQNDHSIFSPSRLGSHTDVILRLQGENIILFKSLHRS